MNDKVHLSSSCRLRLAVEFRAMALVCYWTCLPLYDPMSYTYTQQAYLSTTIVPGLARETYNIARTSLLL